MLFSISSTAFAKNNEILQTNNNILTLSEPVNIKPSSLILKIPVLSQIYPDFIPNGCECVSENMAFKYKGITNISNTELVDSLNKSDDPRLGFMGDMYSIKHYKSSVPTVWPEGIISQVKQYLPNSYYSNNLTIEQLENEIASGNPVLMWYCWQPVDKIILTSNPLDPIKTSGALHCVLLIGYDKDNWYINDPGLGKMRKLDKKTFYNKYLTYGSKSVVVR